MALKTVKVHCVNDNEDINVAVGTTLTELLEQIRPCEKGNGTLSQNSLPIIASLVDNSLKELSFVILNPCRVEFIDFLHPDGRRTYIRSLCFVLQKAVRELFPRYTLCIDYCLPSGLYCELRETAPRLADGKAGGLAKNEDGHYIVKNLSSEDRQAIRLKVKELIEEDLPLTKEKIPTNEAIGIFDQNNQTDKAKLAKTSGKHTVSVYLLTDKNGESIVDTFYGPLAPSTGCLGSFAIASFQNGFCLQYPMEGETTKIAPMQKQSKIAGVMKTNSNWCSVIGITGLGTLNTAIQAGNAVSVINLSEALLDKSYSGIADKIYEKRGTVKVIFIAGPSSSGKTSSSLRLAIHLKVMGLNPKVIELDNYFVSRDLTPKDENGDYDFEALEAMDLKLLNQQLNDLLDGKEVEIPKFNFKLGDREPQGTKMKLEDHDILIMEGIHALNPAMVPKVDNSRIFRLYASALTSLNIDENNNISTSDNRLLRRIVRDNRVRGITPEETLERWHSVRKGENRNIFPFQENADAELNSAMIYELPLLKYYAEPLLRRIDRESPAYTEALRLQKFLEYIVPLTPTEIDAIPPTSIMREFIGGQTL